MRIRAKQTPVVAFLALALAAGAGCKRSPQSYVEAGNRFFKEGKFEDAALNYRKAIQANANYGEAFYRLGLVEMERRDIKSAYAALSRAVELMPDHQEAKAKLADLLVTAYLVDRNRPQSLYDRIHQLAAQFLAKDPNSFDGLRLKGYLALTDQNLKAALDYFRRALAQKPDEPVVQTALVETLFLDQQYGEGEKLAAAMVAQGSKHAQIYDVLYRRYMDSKRIPDAELVLRKKIQNLSGNPEPVLQLARHFFQQKNGAEMERTLELLIQNPKDFPDGRLQAGDFYLSIGRLEEAVKQFEEGARSGGKKKIDCQKRLAGILLSQGKKDDALKLMEEILKQDPKDLPTRRARAYLWLEAAKPEQLDKTIAEFQQLVREKAGEPILHFDLGRVLLMKGDLEAAKKAFHEARRLKEDFIAPRVALAEIAIRQKQPKEIMQYSEEILAQSPREPRGRLLRAIALMGTNENEKARAELTRLVRDLPQYLDAQLQLGLFYLTQKQFKEAEQIFRRLQQARQNDLRPVEGMVESRLMQQQFEEAIKLVEAELKKRPESRSVQLAYARTAARAGKWDAALDTFRKLAAEEPNSPDLHMQMGALLIQKGDMTAAIEAFQKAEKLAPKDSRPLVAHAEALDRTGQKQRAVEVYRRALKVNPNDASALNNLAFLLAEVGGDLDEALRLAQRAVQMSPDNPATADTLGWVYLKKKMTDSALQVFEQLSRKHPDDPVIRMHYGMALIEKGDRERARKELEAALARQPSREDEAKIRELLASVG
jgi:tetratricopeptide (TPR) repeat protein